MLFELPNEEPLLELPVEDDDNVLLFDEPSDSEPMLETLLSLEPTDEDVVLLEVLLLLLDDPRDELLRDELLLLFDEVLLVGVELLLDVFPPLASFFKEEPVLVVLYSLSELLPPLLDQPELGDSSDDEDGRPLPLPLLIETTLT